MNEVAFYKNLPSLKLPLASVFHETYFNNVPADWHVIIADVKASTQAVAAGKHNDVNLVAAGSLIAALNVAKKYNVEVPFFFGGDGSTLLVPAQIHTEVMAALAAHNRNTRKNVGLEMHIGSLPVKEILDSGHWVRLAKMEIDSVYSKAIAIGDGLRYAEQKIKQEIQNDAAAIPQTPELNLTGLECRWDKIKPPREEAENVCYLIEAVNPQKQIDVYAALFSTIEEIYGDLQKRHPLCMEQLKPLFSWQKLKKEMLAKFGHWKPAYFMDAFLRSVYGAFSFKYDWDIGGVRAKEYLSQLIAHADTFAVDGRVNTIICGTQEKHTHFLNYLSAEEKNGRLIYGHYGSKESIMTCYIESRAQRHIHFVDGADGGYTEASKEFKSKLKWLQSVV